MQGPNQWQTLRAIFPRIVASLPPFLERLATDYGAASQFEFPWQRYVFINDPLLIKDVLVTQQHAFTKSEGARLMRLLLGNGLATSEEPLHRRQRRIMQPAFHHERITGYGRTMLMFAGDWVAQRPADSVFDMHAAMADLTLHIASATLFGVDAGPRAQTIRESLRAALKTLAESFGPVAEICYRLPLPSTQRLRRVCAGLDAIIFELITERRRLPGDGNDVLSMLLTAEDPQTGRRLDDRQIRDEVMTLFLAGHETTANALVWTWALLAAHPSIEARFHAEVDAVASFDDPVTALRSLTYARRVMTEAIRLYPPAWVFTREAVTDVTLLGEYHISKGTAIVMSPYVLHRTPAIYRDPLQFDPDRWLDDVPPFTYIPFGGGARRCIGEEFAWMEGTLLLARLGRSFRFTLADGRVPDIAPAITLNPNGLVRMQAIARTRKSATCHAP